MSIFSFILFNPSAKTMTERVEQPTYYVPVELNIKLFDIGKRSTCLVIPPQQNIDNQHDSTREAQVLLGTAGLYQFYPHLYILMTNHHVLPTIDMRIIQQVKFKFEHAALGQIQLKKEDIEFVVTSPPNIEYDATIIELKESFAQSLIDRGAEFLKIKVGEPKQGERIAMLQYPKQVFCHAQGIIESVEEIQINYHLASDLGSSGSPILTWDFEAIGLHRGSYENTTFGLATRLALIRSFFQRFRQGCLPFRHVVFTVYYF